MVKTVCGIALEFDDKLASHYLKVNGDPLGDMVEYYLCANAKTLDVTEAIKGKTKEELQNIVTSIVKEELELNGFPFRE